MSVLRVYVSVLSKLIVRRYICKYKYKNEFKLKLQIQIQVDIVILMIVLQDAPLQLYRKGGWKACDIPPGYRRKNKLCNSIVVKK